MILNEKTLIHYEAIYKLFLPSLEEKLIDYLNSISNCTLFSMFYAMLGVLKVYATKKSYEKVLIMLNHC